MPAIRDWSFNYNTVTTSTSISCPLPAYEQNDLLLAIVSADTGTTQAWSSSGWTQLFSVSNTPNLGMLFKTAGASESDPTFTYSIGETANVALLSIRDVDPIKDTGAGALTINVVAASRTFTRTTGNFTTDGFVAGMTIVSSGFTNGGNNTRKIIESVTATVITVTDGTGLVDETGNNNERIISSPFGGTAGFATSNITAARTAFPTHNATSNNSLIIWAWNHGSTATVIPSAIEGPVTQLTSKDGSAHNDGFAWGFMPSSGTTPAITCSLTGATFNGLKAVAVINPPAAGATVIPTYCAADNSVYVDPIHGVTAYNTNTAWAGTATTYWATPLAGRTLANATAAAQVDRGINTYRSCGGMTGPTTATSTWFGATTVMATANKPNVTGKNVLLHVMPLLPADLQTVDGANLGRGIAVGMASAAANGKVWHVHGAGTPWGITRAPVIVNSNNTTGVIDTRGTFDPSSVLVFGCFTAGFLVSSDWFWAMIWVLDTTVIAGGTASEPVDITGTRIAAADGHERISVVQQAANQLLVMQPLQFGDGGTSPIYLDFNATAIEFPEIYNKVKRQVYYCSSDNVAGITYYAGASDTIKHRNSVISSPSRYHWKLHASSSTSATYDFSGLSVIGAGTISLARAITITELTINDYSTLDVTGLTLNSGTILNPPATSASITTGTTARLGTCTINVSTLTAGNWWWAGADPSLIFQNCAFTGGGGHALSISAVGGSSITLTGNTWTSFGANGTTGAALLFTAGSGTVTVNIAGGTTPTYKATGMTINFVNAKTVKVTAKDADTLAAIENVRVLLEADTGGDLPVNVTVTIVNSGLTATVTHTSHGLVTGNQVKIKGASHAQNNGVFTITVTDANTYTYTMGEAPGSNPTGSITATSVILFGLTNASGILQTTTFNFTSNQPVTGKVRRSTGGLGTRYKTGAITGIITSSGLDTTVLLIPDE